MAIFMDIELVGLEEAEYPDAFAVAFDVIYSGETWCRSLVWVSADLAETLARDEQAVTSAARDALLDVLAPETMPVSFELRASTGGITVLARGSPGGSRRCC